MADGRHFENSFIAISQPEIIRFQRIRILAFWIIPARQRVTRSHRFARLSLSGTGSGSDPDRRPSGLSAPAEVFLVPSWRDVWLGTAGTLEAAEINSKRYGRISKQFISRSPDHLRNNSVIYAGGAQGGHSVTGSLFVFMHVCIAGFNTVLQY